MIVPYVYKDTLLKIQGLNVAYDGRQILRNVDAEIRDIYIPGRVTGQIVAVLGPSGCGKTTLFRMMSGLDTPDSGEVLLADEKGFVPVKAGHVGVVAQSYPLFYHRTIHGNLMLPANAHEPDSKKAEEIVEEGMARFELTELANLHPAQLSGGQRQRVAILQMLLCREEVILMDEPFSGLDLIRLEQAIEAISGAANLTELNTFIIVTHDVTAAVSIADHIWLLGHEYDAANKQIPGTRIVQTYDLLERGLCYEKGAVTNPRFADTIREIKERFRTL
jgi:NitT/TauT family transport system ATP-binding protein